MHFNPKTLLLAFLFVGHYAYCQIPITLPDVDSTPEDTPREVKVLVNDTDLLDTIDPTTVDLDPSTPAIDNTLIKTGEGTFSADVDGVVTFTPEPNFFGNSVANYTVANLSGVTSLPSFISITVTAVNDPPVAADDNTNTMEDFSTSMNVLANDTDVDNALNDDAVDLNPATLGIDASVSDASGTYTAANGTITYTPTANYNGPASVSYTVQDASGATSNVATFSVSISAVNDPPIAVADSETTAEDTDVSLKITSNDTDVDGTIDDASVDLDLAAGGMQTTITTTQGTFTYDGAGVVDYDPAANFNGIAGIQYTVQDNQGATSAPGDITITVTSVNDPPVAVADAASTSEGVAINIAVLANDTDPDNNIDVSSVDLNTSMLGIQSSNTTTEGTWTANASGVVNFAPVAGFNGNAVLNYTVEDLGNITSNVATITVSVSVVNDAPVANNDNATTPEDEDVTINVVANDTDADGTINAASVDLNLLTAGIQSTMTTTSGNYSVSTIGIVTFTPLSNFHGVATLPYTVQDNDGLTSNNATITVTVTDVNDAPVAVNDATSTDEETLVTLNVVSNDTDVDGTIAANSVDLNVALGGIQNNNTTAAGSYTVNGAGVVSFTPAANFSGAAILNYTVNDDDGTASNQATITINVSSDNDNPVAVNDALTILEDAATTTLNVVANDTDADGTINIATVDLNTTLAGIQTTATVTGGSFSVSATGIVSFTPMANFSGAATVNYTVNDNDGATSNAATITITVTSVNDAPVAANDAASTTEETPITLNVVSNDTDIDGTIAANSVDLNMSTAGIQGTIVTSDGTFTVNAAGVVSFTPVANFNGIAVVSYTVNDNNGLASNQATISITVNEENDAPVAVADATTTNEDTPVTLNVVTNDTDSDGTINASTVDLNTSTPGVQSSNSNAAGSYAVNASGVVTFTPTTNYSGSATILYTVNDDDGATSNAVSINITVNAVNDAPSAIADAASTNEGVAVNVSVLANDSDIDGTIVASTVDLNVTTPGIQTSNTATGGTFTVNAAGVVTFTPLSNFNGTASIQYTVQDNGSAESNPATITITVNSINDLPVAVDDAVTTNEDVVVTLNVVSNDTDADGTINVASVDLNVALAGIQTTNSNASGNFSVNASGVVTYTPTANYSGTATLQYRVNDNDGATSNNATITITVNAVNDVPVANNDAIVTNEDAVATINVVTNDTDVDGTINAATVDLNLLSSGIQNTATISGGTLSVNTAGVITFTPTVNFYGNTSVTYTVNDNSGATSNAATVAFTVNAVNDPPIANNDITSADENETVTLNLVANDVDIDGTINVATVDLNPASSTIQTTRTIPAGTFTVDAAGVVTFDPALNFNGIASITYTVQDNGGTTSNAATITVTVNSINSTPVANNDAISTNEDVNVSMNVTTNDTDADGTINAATVDLNTTTAGIQNSHSVAEGTFTVNAMGNVTFAPVANFNGTATTTYTVNDNVGVTSNTATFTVTVVSVNDLPVANEDAATTTEGMPVTLNVIVNDTDVDGTIDPASVDLNTATAGIQNANTTAAGSFTVNNLGVVTFTPVGTFSGAATLPYRVNDDSGGTSISATITITVTAVNDAPVAVNDATTTNEDASVTLNVVSNDTDEDGTVSASSVDLNTATAGIQNSLSVAEGNFTVSASGVVTFAPASNFNGTVQIVYTVNDNGGATSAPATITITVTPVNDAPVAVNDVLTTGEGNDATLAILSNDTDIDGTIDVATVDLNVATPAIESTRTTAAGKFSASATGVLTFEPTDNYAGNTSITYRVKDNLGLFSNNATIAVTVNASPVAKDFVMTAQEDIAKSLSQSDFTAAFTDSNGDALVKIKVTTLPQHGTLRIGTTPVTIQQEILYNSIPNLSYLPSIDYSGTDVFTWQGYDGFSYSNAASVTVTISPENDAPMITAIESSKITYDQGVGQPILVTETFEAVDHDDEFLSIAQISLGENYRVGNDVLIFFDTDKIVGSFNAQSGELTLAGVATVHEYVTAIRSIRYDFVNSEEIVKETRVISFKLSDGEQFSEPKTRELILDYSLEDLDIPNAFTPNNDEANDTWKIKALTSGNSDVGLLKDAEIKIYNPRGMLVYEAIGFDNAWDGTMNGEALPTGPYYYTIDLKFDQKIFKGIVTILR
ncbi:tandem-95 repeat protein [Pseudochryseolinea flava]|uniref:Cadherin domain-containing protein n=1 Tax=Pseudochryseolinea flava TaxID=2059302 RepID=A0A364Y5M6_9BACT|nr:tandem-95 repeat protein [Pseudochryseolinea flava]RAW01361.1 hypothetical protein DQQ10_10680 [Pseudochryseolinea flava]